MRNEEASELAHHIATPALLGQHLGPRLLGAPYILHPWLLWLERRVLHELLQPGRKIIVVSVPPQNGKTTYFGLFLILWYLGMNPSHQVIFISYNEQQASKWGLRTRDAMKRFGPELFGVGIHPSSDSQLDWKMSNGFGGMMSAGIMGGITGNPGHLIVADDLLKGDEDAGSAAVKLKIMGEVEKSVFSRFQLNTKMLMIATRWAEDDPSGQLIELSRQPGYQGIPIEYINIKAIAEPSFEEREQIEAELVEEMADQLDAADPDERDGLLRQALLKRMEGWQDFLGRKEGEALQGQFDQAFYEERRSTMTDGWFPLYQGEPTVREGGMFPLDCWGYYEPNQLPDITKKVRVWDLAASEGRGDYTVGTLMGRGSDGNFYILDRERGRWATDDVERHVMSAAQRDGYEVTILVEMERAGAGKTVFEHYKRKLIGYNVEEAKAEGSKQSRATPYSNEQRKGNIYLPSDKPWLKEWREEHVQADGDKKWPIHDDQIDTGAYAFKFLNESGASEFWDASQLYQRALSLADDEAQMEALAMARLIG